MWPRDGQRKDRSRYKHPHISSWLEWKTKKTISRNYKWTIPLIISIQQLSEIQRVVQYPKLGFQQDQISRFLAILSEVATCIETKHEINIARDSDDNMLLEAAFESGSKIVITGDDDLLSIQHYKDISIMTVHDFLQNKHNQGSFSR